MQDNVHVCPRCNGTGEVRITYHVCLRYQDCSEWEGPFPTEEAARARAAELNLEADRWGYIAAFHAQEEKL